MHCLSSIYLCSSVVYCVWFCGVAVSVSECGVVEWLCALCISVWSTLNLWPIWVGALKFLEAGLSLTVEIRELDLEVEPSWTECHTHTKHRAEVFCLYCYRLHKPHHTTEDTYIETVFICSKSRFDRQQDRHINRPSDWGARFLFQNLYIIGLSKFRKKESSAPVTGSNISSGLLKNCPRSESLQKGWVTTILHL